MTHFTGYARKQEPRWFYISVGIFVFLLVFLLLLGISLAGKRMGSFKQEKAQKEAVSLPVTTVTVMPKITPPVSRQRRAIGNPTIVGKESGNIVGKIVFTSKVDERNLPADSLEKVSVSGQGRLFCYTRINSPVVPQIIRHVWIDPEGREFAEIRLNISRQPADTWSYVNLSGAETGVWELQVKNAEGTILAKRSLTVTND